MKFSDLFVSRREYFSVGIEEESGSYYISFQVSNQLCDYEEYYWISTEEFTKCEDDLLLLLPIVEECRNHQRDDDLVVKPGRDRGVST